MNNSLKRFDEWLNRLLEQCAREAGEDVHTYVARAVASQMVADRRLADSSVLEELMAHLAGTGVFTESDMPSVESALTDPDRLAALHATGLLDSPPPEAFDRITRAAAQALDVPVATVSLIDVDRQVVLSTFNQDGNADASAQIPLDWSVCQYTVAQGSSLILEDARTDPVFKHHPAVRAGTVVAYLGIPMKDGKGNAIGTMCVCDEKPRAWATGHVQILADLTALAAETAFSETVNRGS